MTQTPDDVTTVTEEPILSVKIQTPGGLIVEIEIDQLPRDIIADLFSDPMIAGKHIHKLTALPVQIEQKTITRFY